MALLDLQDMELPEEEADGLAAGGGSKGSKGCNNGSRLSLLLC